MIGDEEALCIGVHTILSHEVEHKGVSLARAHICTNDGEWLEWIVGHVRSVVVFIPGDDILLVVQGWHGVQVR